MEVGVMRIFYHVTRDIELPAPGRGASRDRPARACEACGGPIPLGEGSETGTYGLSFCPGCRERLDRTAIQIHFCDGCGVSVPIYAVEEGSALTGDGRILCLKCRAPAARPESRVLLVALAAAIATAIGVAFGLARS